MAYNPNNPNGQQTMANSAPVVIASNQSAVAISAASLPLPSGAATEATLSLVNGKLPSGLTVTSTHLLVDSYQAGSWSVSVSNFPATQPISGTVTALQGTSPWVISAASLPLPTGASTSALQTTGNSSLSSIDGKVPSNLTVTATRLLVDGSGVTQPISAVSLPLPTGASTSALQTTGNTSLSSIDGKIPSNLTVTSTRLLVDGSGVTQPVSGTVAVSNFPATQPVSGTVAATQSGTWNITNISGTISLPTGAATESTLSTLNGKVPSGLTVTSTRLLVDGSGVTQPISGSVSVSNFPATQAVTQSGAWSVTANAGTNLNTSLLALDTSVNGILRAQGSTTSGQSGPLVQGAVTTAAPTYTTAQTSPLSLTTAGALRVDSSGSTQPISGTVAATQSGAWTTGRTWTLASGTDSVAAVQSGTWNITNISGTVSLPTGAATSALQTTGNSSLSNIDSSTSSINGKLGTLGQKLMAGSAPVTIASDQSALAVSQSGTWNINNVSGTVSLPTGASTSALQTTGNSSLSSIDTKIPSNLTVTATRLLVDGSGVTQPVSGTVTANQGGAPWSSNITQFGGVALSTGTGASGTGIPRVTVANDSNILATQSGTWNITNVSGTVSLPTGASTSALQTTGNSSLSSIDGKLNSLGQKTMANSMPVTIASDQSTLNVSAAPVSGSVATYGASIVGLVVPALATDVFTITGSATKTVKIVEIGIGGSASAAVNLNISVVKRSTANTLGTSTTPTVVPHDSNNAAGTAVVRAYTVNPTLGNTVGTLKTFKPLIDSTTIAANNVLWQQQIPAQALVLRGTSEVIAINFNVTTITTPVFNMYFVWTEE